MPEFLLELGCEELPASFVENAGGDLADRLKEALEEAYQTAVQIANWGTPRRLIISVADLPAIQPDAVKEVRGPGIKAAYDAEGKPTGALMGFCRSQGIEPGDLRQDKSYVWATKVIAGLPTGELLATIIPAAIRKLTFEKSMRWGPFGAKFRFARPIRWILAAFDGKPITFTFEGVESGMTSLGHRFYAGEPFTSGSLEDLLNGLRERSVEPDPVRRREMIMTRSAALASRVEMADELVDENVYLTEWPTPILGSFRPEFLELPEPVLTTAMAKHEKMFPVRDEAGALTNHFVFVRNSGEDDTVRRGAEWVLNARLADADFFYREDKKSSVDDFLEKTGGIVFQAQLGTIRQRADRLAALAKYLAETVSANPALALAAEIAGKYAKADLSSGLVAEFSSLQGIVGGEYMSRAGFDAEVCRAVANQYRQLPLDDPHELSTVLIVADSLDKLAGYLGIGLVPTGSADPYGLRRAATNLILSGISGDMASHFAYATKLYGFETKPEALKALEELFAARYESLFAGHRYDLVQAAVFGGAGEGQGVLNPALVTQRLEWLEKLTKDDSFVQTMLRPLNIYKSFKEEIPEVEDLAAKLGSASGEALYAALTASESSRADERLIALAPKIHEFFESTMIMDQDLTARAARQRLVALVREAILAVGDFTRVVIEGN